MRLFFAGCARDCSDVLDSNISALLAIGDMEWCDEIRVYVAENSSKDNSREIISRLVDMDSRVIPLFLDDLDEQMPVREARIAFCRDRLLEEVCKADVDGIYIPIDLDSHIASSLEPEDLKEACELVASGKCTGVFPYSSPYYYDIHALREPEWCPRSCWKEIHDCQPRGALWGLLVYIRYVSLRQKPHSRLKTEALIPVVSAFGGMGVYSLAKICETRSRYSSPELEIGHLRLCEHVVFNSSLDNLYINPAWAIHAPSEHIEFRLLPLSHKAWRIARAVLVDSRRIIYWMTRLDKILANCAGRNTR